MVNKAHRHLSPNKIRGVNDLMRKGNKKDWRHGEYGLSVSVRNPWKWPIQWFFLTDHDLVQLVAWAAHSWPLRYWFCLNKYTHFGGLQSLKPELRTAGLFLSLSLSRLVQESVGLANNTTFLKLDSSAHCPNYGLEKLQQRQSFLVCGRALTS